MCLPSHYCWRPLVAQDSHTPSLHVSFLSVWTLGRAQCLCLSNLVEKLFVLFWTTAGHMLCGNVQQALSAVHCLWHAEGKWLDHTKFYSAILGTVFSVPSHLASQPQAARTHAYLSTVPPMVGCLEGQSAAKRIAPSPVCMVGVI